MFKKIGDRIRFPDWAAKCTRYKRLDILDRLLDGTFYDHLPYAFYDELDHTRVIPLADKRPSAQYRLPRMVSRWCARKLFAGRHRPKLRLQAATKRKPGDKPKANPKLGDLNKLLRRACFWPKMGEAVFRGSVGSVAVTFKSEGEGKDARLAVIVWQAKYCKPSFDDFGALAQLRISYPTAGSQLKAAGFITDSNNKPLDDGEDYWFIRDFLTDKEMTFVPVPKAEWNPEHGFVGDGSATKQLREFEPKTVVHDLKFVPGHWFVNMPGGTGSDGECTWFDAIPNSIDLDYILSQMGRGTRYNGAPQLVVVGNILNADDDGATTRGPMTALQVQAGYKEEDGQTIGAGDAKLLEMTGTGIKAGLELIDKLRNLALEQIAASRKDPDKMKAPMSGRAMEYLDEDSDDLVMELRNAYGEDGALPLLRKIAIATGVMSESDAGAMTLQWPRLFQPTPDEVFALAQAFQLLIDPLGHATAATPGEPAQPGGAGADGRAKPGKPAVPPQEAQAPEEDMQLMTIPEARAYIQLNLDLAMLDLDDGDDTEQVDDSPTPPGEPTEVIPIPSAIDEDAPPATPEGDQGDVSASAQFVAATAGGPV